MARLNQRRTPAAEIINRLRNAVAHVRDIQLHLQSIHDIQIETRPTRTQYQYVLQDPNENELRYWANKFVKELRKRHDFSDLASDQQDLGQQMSINVDRTAAARLGLNMAAVDKFFTTPSVSARSRRSTRQFTSIT